MFPNQTIVHFAGTAPCDYSGEGGIATVAQLHFTFNQMAADPSGNIYIGDDVNHAIRRVDVNTYVVLSRREVHVTVIMIMI